MNYKSRKFWFCVGVIVVGTLTHILTGGSEGYFVFLSTITAFYLGGNIGAKYVQSRGNRVADSWGNYPVSDGDVPSYTTTVSKPYSRTGGAGSDHPGYSNSDGYNEAGEVDRS